MPLPIMPMPSMPMPSVPLSGVPHVMFSHITRESNDLENYLPCAPQAKVTCSYQLAGPEMGRSTSAVGNNKPFKTCADTWS